MQLLADLMSAAEEHVPVAVECVDFTNMQENTPNSDSSEQVSRIVFNEIPVRGKTSFDRHQAMSKKQLSVIKEHALSDTATELHTVTQPEDEEH